MQNVNIELAYLAGLIDGEGHIGFRYKAETGELYPVIRIDMCNKTVLLLLHLQFGGSFGIDARGTGNRRTTWRWQINSKLAISILKDVLPCLIVKKQQAKLVIEYFEIKDALSVDDRLDFKSKMHVLNKRGTA